jgi:hypothetical protein
MMGNYYKQNPNKMTGTLKIKRENKKKTALIHAKMYNTGVGKNKIYFLGNPGLTSPDMN